MLDIVGNNESMAISLLLEQGGPGAREANPRDNETLLPQAHGKGDTERDEGENPPSSAERPAAGEATAKLEPSREGTSGGSQWEGQEGPPGLLEDPNAGTVSGAVNSDQVRTVVEVTGVSETEALGALEATGGHTERAIQILLG